MRDRLVAAFVGLVVATVLLYGIPRAYLLADLVQGAENSEVQRSADLVTLLLDERAADDGAAPTPTELDRLLRGGESLEVLAADGTVVRAGLPASRDAEADVVATRELADGGTVTLRRTADLVDRAIADALLPLVLLGLVLVLAAAAVGRLLADRLARPFGHLASAADAIGQGRFDVEIPHFRVAEAEAVGSALRRGSTRLAELVRRERDVAANASHELRTPISALRLQIEDLASWPQTPPDVAAELRASLGELDRLGAAVRTYLDQAQQDRLTDVDAVDLAAVVRQVVEGWRAAATDEDPTVVLVDEPAGPLPVRTSAATVEDILRLLLRDAADRGARHVLLEVDSTHDLGRVRVGLEGPDPAPVSGDARAEVTRTALSVDGRLTALEDHVVLTLALAT